MSHMVIFRTAEGKPGYHQSENLDEAVRFVEHLRNSENVSDARIFRMQEVPIEFKTYVRVEVAGMDEAPGAAPGPVAPAAPVAAGPAPVAPVGAAAAPVAPTVVDKSDDVVVDPMPAGAPGPGGGAGAGGPGGPGGANNRFGRFNRG